MLLSEDTHFETVWDEQEEPVLSFPCALQKVLLTVATIPMGPLSRWH